MARLTHQELLVLQIAETAGLLTPVQASQARDALKTARVDGNPIELTDLLLHWGYLTPEQALQLANLALKAVDRVQQHEISSGEYPAAQAPDQPQQPAPADQPPAIPSLGQGDAATHTPPGIPSLTQQPVSPPPPPAGLDPTASGEGDASALPDDLAAPSRKSRRSTKSPSKSSLVKVKMKRRAAQKSKVRRIIVGCTVAVGLIGGGVIGFRAANQAPEDDAAQETGTKPERTAKGKRSKNRSKKMAKADARAEASTEEPQKANGPDQGEDSAAKADERPTPPKRPPQRTPLGEAHESTTVETPPRATPALAREIGASSRKDWPQDGGVASVEPQVTEYVVPEVEKRVFQIAGKPALPVREWAAIGPFGDPKLKDRPAPGDAKSAANSYVSKLFTEAKYLPDRFVLLSARFKGASTRDVAGDEPEIGWEILEPGTEPADLKGTVVSHPPKQSLKDGVGLTYFSTWLHVPLKSVFTAQFPAYGEDERSPEKLASCARVWINGEPVKHYQVDPDNPHICHPVYEQPVTLAGGPNHVCAKVWSTGPGTKMALVLRGESQALQRVRVSECPPSKIGPVFTVSGTRAKRANVPACEDLVPRRTFARGEPVTPDPSDVDFLTNKMPRDATKYHEHWYKVYARGLSWQTARERCRSLRGDLAYIGSKEENAFVVKLVGANYAWLGGSDRTEEGVWRWGNGKEFKYLNWGTEGPGSGSDEEDYLYLCPDGKWGDGKNRMRPTVNFFVCEWNK